MRARTGLDKLAWGATAAMCGLSGLLSGCSDPTPPPSKGSVELHVSPGSSCTAHVMKAPKGITHPSSDNVVTDGDNGQVSCHVSSGSPHVFTGSLTYDDGNGDFAVTLSATIPDQAISQATAVDGSIHLYENVQQATYSAPATGAPSCKFWLGDPANPPPTGADGIAAYAAAHVTEGGIWGQVSCSAMVGDGHANDVCELGVSTFMFLDCSTD